MTDSTIQYEKITEVRFKYLWILMVAFTMALFASNWFDPRHIEILGLCTGAGSIAFPLTYLLADVITEVYGFKNARMAIWFGILLFMMFIGYGQFVIFFSKSSIYSLPLHNFFYTNTRIVAAAIISFLATESANSFLVANLKKRFKGKYIGFRFIFSTLFAYLIDELTYAPIAFSHIITNKSMLVHHMLDSWAFMFSIEILLLPVSIRLAKSMKKIEKCDIYDNNTKFNLLRINTSYKPEDNRYEDN